MAMPFDLVAEVRCFFGVLRASSKANFEYAIDADARQHGFLHHHLALGAGEHAAADSGIFAFGILAHHPEIDVAGLAIGERRRHARHQPHRAQIDVLVELAAEQNERAPQRNVIGHLRRPADRAEEDGVVAADLLLPVLRHHALVLGVIVVGGEIEVVLPQFETEFLGRCFEHAHALGNDFLADAVAGNDGDVVDAVGGPGAVSSGLALKGGSNEVKPTVRENRCSRRSIPEQPPRRKITLKLLAGMARSPPSRNHALGQRRDFAEVADAPRRFALRNCASKASLLGAVCRPSIL